MNMLGTRANTSEKCKYTCSTCLTTTHRVNPISIQLKNEYKKIMEIDTEDPEMRVCNICHWQFWKFLKFKQQCQTAKTLMIDAIEMKLQLCQNLEKTITEIHSVDPNLQENLAQSIDSQININTDIKTSNNSINSTDNDYDADDNDDITLSNLSTNKVFNTPKNTKNLKDVNDQKSLIREKRGGKRKKKDMNKTEFLESSKTQKKSKKELREGFSSRMVQETDEYIVIKLSKDQVLIEMEEKSKTDVFIHSPFKCEKCVKGFNFEDVLKTHMEKHTMEHGSFQCDLCHQFCRSAVSLRGHIKSHTTRYKCKLCDVVRLSRQHLLEHHAISHTVGAITYSCDTCPFNTNKRTVMQRHVKKHVKTERHACEQCGKLFKSIDTLRVHTMRHNKSSKFRCTLCDVTFIYHSLLRRHVTQVHERRDHYCVECDAQFKSSESLRLHFKKAKKHRDDSSYKYECSECPVRCVSVGALCAHRAHSHGATRAHACSVCRRTYSGKDALRAHLWRAHSTKHTDKEI